MELIRLGLRIALSQETEMGWKGNIRSFNAAVRRIERESERRHKLAVREMKAHKKMLQIAHANSEAANYQQGISRLTSLHMDCARSVDWGEVKSTVEPEKPVLRHENEEGARHRLVGYSPSFFQRMFFLENWIRRRLNKAVELGKRKDEEEFQSWTKKYDEEFPVWKENYELATIMLSDSVDSQIEVLQELDLFRKYNELGVFVKFSKNTNVLEVNVYAPGLEVVPTESKTALKSGKLSVKELTGRKINEQYQSFIFSLFLRVVRDLFALVPKPAICVNVYTNLLNEQTGHKDSCTILSVFVPLRTVNDLHFETINPRESIKNFVHNVEFKKDAGFTVVDKVDVSRLSVA
jgi:hypothetical protein